MRGRSLARGRSFLFSSSYSLRFLNRPQWSSAMDKIVLPKCGLSTLQLEDEERSWTRTMAECYGPGNYQLFRSLYKDLCDEMRNESATKPPPPLSPVVRKKGVDHPGESTTELDESLPRGASSHGKAPIRQEDVGCTVIDKGARLEQELGSKHPNVTYGDGSWSTSYDPSNNIVTFRRDAIKETRQGQILAYAVVEIKDPPKLNAMLTFLDWYPIEVLITRNGVILHFSIACNEGGMHMRNVRAYDAAASPVLMQSDKNAQWVRENLFYDGPCLWHLEMDFQNELYDIMQDHGVDLDWVRWAAQWIFYLEHVNYTKWNLGMLEELIPSDQRGPEEDFLLETERAALNEPVEESLSGRGL